MLPPAAGGVPSAHSAAEDQLSEIAFAAFAVNCGRTPSVGGPSRTSSRSVDTSCHQPSPDIRTLCVPADSHRRPDEKLTGWLLYMFESIDATITSSTCRLMRWSAVRLK